MTEQAEKYNGYENFDTWNVNLWLTNDEWAYNKVRNYLTFLASRQTDKPGPDLQDQKAGFGTFVRTQVFGGSTPDGVSLAPKDCKVNWSEIVAGWQEYYGQEYEAWHALLDRNGAKGVHSMTTGFRTRHHDARWTLEMMQQSSVVYAHKEKRNG